MALTIPRSSLALPTALLRLAILLCMLLISCNASSATTDARANPGLRALSDLVKSSPGATFSAVGEQIQLTDMSREIVSFESDGLRQYALLLRPLGKIPDAGWPVLLFNHGYHPDPPRYGQRGADGVLDRPGDYYRSLPQAFAREGFVVIVPDYRGHGPSEGVEYTTSPIADFWYSRDVVTAYFAASAMEDIDLRRIHMLGHSMGGGITLRAARALGKRIRSAAVWSPSRGDALSYVYRQELSDRSDERPTQDTGTLARPRSDALAMELQSLNLSIEEFDLGTLLNGLRVPMLIEHSQDDQTTPVATAYALAARLRLLEGPYALQIVPGDDHLFTGENLDLAIKRCIEWFRRF